MTEAGAEGLTQIEIHPLKVGAGDVSLAKTPHVRKQESGESLEWELASSGGLSDAVIGPQNC